MGGHAGQMTLRSPCTDVIAEVVTSCRKASSKVRQIRSTFLYEDLLNHWSVAPGLNSAMKPARNDYLRRPELQNVASLGWSVSRPPPDYQNRTQEHPSESASDMDTWRIYTTPNPHHRFSTPHTHHAP